MSADGDGVYLDASALVKLVIEEAETAALQRYLADGPPLYSSRIASTEIRRAAARQVERDAAEQVETLLATLRFVELDEPMSSAAGAVEPRSLRTLHAIHLASALSVADGLRAVVAYDARLAAAAAAAGLNVEVPGREPRSSASGSARPEA